MGKSKVAYRSLRQVHGFKYKIHNGGHLDHFSTHQTEFLVVVQHRVHVLHPHGVDWSVEYDPLSVWRCQRGILTERVGRYAI